MSEWLPLSQAPHDTAVLVYGVCYEVAHYNTALKRWALCSNHQPLYRESECVWTHLPEPPSLGTVQKWREPMTDEQAALERATGFAAQGRFKLPRYEDLRTGDGEPLPPQDERGKRMDVLTQQYLDGMKQ